MSGKLKVGIIGGGGIAGAHVKNYKKLDWVDVAAVADVVPGRAEQFIEKWELEGAKPFVDFRDLLELDLDAVSICTPNAAHHAPTVAALRAGKHVMLEKPMSVTLEDAVDMVRTARETGRMLSIGFQPRYDPNMELLKELVQSGRLGHVYYVETGGGRRRGMPRGTFQSKALAGAGAIADIGCYSLDLAMNTLGHPKPLTVSAVTTNHFGTDPRYNPEADKFEVEDFGVALIRFDNGMVLNFKISWAMHMDTLGATLFLGTDAGLKVTPAGTGPWSGVWDGRVGTITMFHDIGPHHTASPIPIIEHNKDLFFEKIRDFAEAVRDGRPAPIPGEQILRSQAIIDGILRSAAAGREVEIRLPDLG